MRVREATMRGVARQYRRISYQCFGVIFWLTSVSLGGAVDAQVTVSDAGNVRVSVRTESGAPLVGAQLGLNTVTATAETDDDGAAVVRGVSSAGSWYFVRRIGYRPDSIFLRTPSGRTTAATMIMQRVAVELAPYSVFGRRAVTGPMVGFYQRRSTGSGRYFTHADIVRRSPRSLIDILRGIPGMGVVSRQQRASVRNRGSRCAPVVWLDGQPLLTSDIDLDALDPLSFDGIEVYGTASVPMEFLANQRVGSSCGTIVLWTRRGEPRQSASRKPSGGARSPASHVSQLLDERRVFAAADVDVVARMDSMSLVPPVYPDSLYNARIAGTVLAEFVVGANGVVDAATVSAVTTTHAALIDAVRRALDLQRFIPAMRRGQPVPQVVQLSFRFVPDSIARPDRLHNWVSRESLRMRSATPAR